LHFILTEGQAHDSTTAAELLAGRTASRVIADRAYDNNALRELINAAGAQAVIPSTRSRTITIPHDRLAYRLRNRIERTPHATTDAPATSLPLSTSQAP
jgi:transposase